MAVSAHIPKNILIPKSWKAVVFVDERATAEQESALLKLFTGQLGGAVADLAGLIGEVVAVERAPITFTVDGGKGRLTIGELVDAEMVPFVGATGNPTILAETVFSTIPGSPVYASKASQYTQDGSAHGIPTSTSRTTTPSRATSASRPDATAGRDDCSRPRTCASRVATGRSWRGRSSGIAVVAWLALWLWEGSPLRRLPPSRGRRRVRSPLEVGLFVVGWMLMIVAMMLPSSIPLVVTFGALVRRRRQPGRLVAAAARRLPRRLGGVRARGLGRGSGRPCRRRRASRGSPSTRRSSSPRPSPSPACGSSARCGTAASTSAGARSGSS